MQCNVFLEELCMCAFAARRQRRLEHRRGMEVGQIYLWKMIPMNHHRRLTTADKERTVTCSLLSVSVLHATLTCLRLTHTWRGDSCEVILMPADIRKVYV
jgi:hypothetical protein